MLASTVQFSNNDQPPITPPLQASSLGPALRKNPFPQTPNSVPDPPGPSFIRSTPKQYWEEKETKCAE
jgi:hypothetical protein